MAAAAGGAGVSLLALLRLLDVVSAETLPAFILDANIGMQAAGRASPYKCHAAAVAGAGSRTPTGGATLPAFQRPSTIFPCLSPSFHYLSLPFIAVLLRHKVRKRRRVRGTKEMIDPV